jgi:NAD+ synthase (glutamine-hydrolysing)
MRKLRLALAQINATVGDFDANVARVRDTLARAEALGAELVLFPELVLCGYPAEDLLLKSDFLEANRKALLSLAPAARRVTAVVGFADRGDDVYNAAAILHDGRVAGVYHKHHLPNYAVFDEKRYFQSGREPLVLNLGGVQLGVTICEDMWYPDGPHVLQAQDGAEILLCLSASPFHRGKTRDRERMLATRAADNVAIVAFTNLVGGQDELVFDGGSVVFDERGELIARARAFEEDLVLCDLDAETVFRARLHDPRRRDGTTVKAELAGSYLPVRHLMLEKPAWPERSPQEAEAPVAPELSPLDEVHQALVLGMRDYVTKNGFESVVLGLSGGVDSALTAALAVDAIGPDNVNGVLMPSSVTSEQSRADACDLAERLGIRVLTVPIEPVVEAYGAALAPAFAGRATDVTEENLQARARGNVLMALSNKFGWLVLTTGNKSELSVGYCTLYGDMAGGFAILKDVPKTLVYALSQHLNSQCLERGKRPPIPDSTLLRPPTAELRPGQRDQDVLPPYEILDEILLAYVEKDMGADELVAHGFDPALVSQVVRWVDGNEYKRRQAPPGIRISPRAFGRDRRLPITNQFRPGEKPKRKSPKDLPNPSDKLRNPSLETPGARAESPGHLRQGERSRLQ